jgi:2-amino-4-hydroxy-6-hydroxymethyldihydropteridine diphosphokinase
MTPAFIGIGSNLNDPVRQVELAFELLQDADDIRLIARSSLYRSEAFGSVAQPSFVNAVALLHTTLDPRDLLNGLQDIENAQGRKRDVHWGPRTLDLDLLLHGDVEIDEPGLKVPHPGIAYRNFVLLPLREIAPDLVIPGLGRLEGIAVDENEPPISRIQN